MSELDVEKSAEFLHELWTDIGKSILSDDWHEIMLAQVEKAKRGDTAAAKFITEHISIYAEEDDSNPHATPALWEELALELRDKVGAEISAENLVVIVLRNINVDNVRAWLRAYIDTY